MSDKKYEQMSLFDEQQNEEEFLKDSEEYKEKLNSLSGDDLMDEINEMTSQDLHHEKLSSENDSGEIEETLPNEGDDTVDSTKNDEIGLLSNEEAEKADSIASEESNSLNEEDEVFAGHSTALKALIDQDKEENPDDDDENFVVDNYHYYDTKSILEKACISPQLMKQAEALLNSENPPYLTGVQSGFLEIKGAVEPGGECTVFEADNVWNVDLTYVKDRVIHTYCSICSYYRRPSNASFYHEPCIHEAVAILLLCQYLDEKDTTDATNTAAANFLDSALGSKEAYSNANRPLAVEGSSIKEEPLHLEMRLETPKNENRIFVSFYIGTNHLYKVKNLRRLIAGFHNEVVDTFGKDTDIYLSEHLLDDKSKEVYQWLREEFDSFIRTKERFKTSQDIKYGYATDVDDDLVFPNTLVLDADRWDPFFEIENGQAIEYSDRSGSKIIKKSFTLKDGRLDLKLKISPSQTNENGRKLFDGVLVESASTRLFKGKEYVYEMTDSEIIRSNQLDSKIGKSLILASNENGIKMRIGRSSLNDFWHIILPKLREAVDVEISEEDYIEKYIVPEPQYHFYLDEQDSVVYGQAEVSYGGARYSLSDWAFSDSTPIGEGFRKRSGEEGVYFRFSKYFPNFSPNSRIFYAKLSDEEMFDLLDHGLNELMDIGDVRVTDNFRKLKLRQSVPVRFGISLNSGIMDLSVSSDDITADELQEIMSAYKGKNRFYKLKNGDFLKLDDNPTVESLEEMMDEMHISLKDFVKGHMEVPAYRALYLEHMLSDMEDVYTNRDSHFRSLVRAFKSFEDSDYEVPKELNAKLRAYQEEGYEWLRTLDEWNFGGILADEMGLGKTLQTISCILAVHEGVSLIVCPASLVYNWGEEISKFAPTLKTALLSGNADERGELISHIEDFDIAVTSYYLLKRDIDKYEGHEFRFVVVDEAQNVKNAETAIAKSVKLIKAHTHFALTGTPIENRVSELWSIFDFVMPGYLYDYKTFRSEMETPIMKEQDENALGRLKKMVSPFILRRKKEDVLKDLPEKLEEVRFARMDYAQQRLYDAEVLRMKKKLVSQSEEEFKNNKIAIFAELTKIREICCDPTLLLPDYDGESAKTEMCMDLIQSLIEGQHRTLIFSQFTSMFEILEKRLKAEGIEYFKITGGTPKKTRLDLVKKFNDGDIPVFLISLKAGGTGLNLTGADVVIHFDPWWNLAAQNQATDRAHRIGQTKTVTVFKLIVKGTIEEKILALQESKKKLSDDILGGEGVGESTLNKDELMELLG